MMEDRVWWSPMVHTRVVLAPCPKICIRDGHADWKRDREIPSFPYVERLSILLLGQFPGGEDEGISRFKL